MGNRNGQSADISTHTPRTGSDSIIDGITGSIGISTHTPRTGSDWTCWKAAH